MIYCSDSFYSVGVEAMPSDDEMTGLGWYKDSDDSWVHPDFADSSDAGHLSDMDSHPRNNNILLCAGKVRGFSNVGSYPIFYLNADNDTFSAAGIQDRLSECLDKEDHYYIVSAHVNYETTDMVCEITGEPIASAYGGR